MDRTERARLLIYGYIKSRMEKTDTHITFALDEVYVVWSCYILGHWKMLLSTTLPDGMYYEVTYNSTTCETYVDAYKKFENICIKSEHMKDALEYSNFHVDDPFTQKSWARGDKPMSRQFLAPGALRVPAEGVPIVDRTKDGPGEVIGHAKVIEDEQGLRFEGKLFGKEQA